MKFKIGDSLKNLTNAIDVYIADAGKEFYIMAEEVKDNSGTRIIHYAIHSDSADKIYTKVDHAKNHIRKLRHIEEVRAEGSPY